MKTVKYKTPLIALALIALASPLAHARNAVDGGGSGGLCTESSCKTLAQAGLRVVTETRNPFYVDAAVTREIRSVLGQLPLAPEALNALVQATLGYPGVFKIVAPADVKKFAAYRNEYLQLLRRHGQGLDATQLRLFAVSDHQNTYLIQDSPTSTFYDRLDTRGKALLMIHEAMIRSFRANAIQANRVDGMLQDLPVGSRPPVDTQVQILAAMAEANVISDEQRDEAFVGVALRSQGGSATIGDFCDKAIAVRNGWGDSYCMLNMENAIRLQNVSPLLPNLMVGIFVWARHLEGGACEIRESGKIFLENGQIRYEDASQKCSVELLRGK